MAYSSLITLQPQQKWLMPAGLEYMLVDLSDRRADLRRVIYSPSGFSKPEAGPFESGCGTDAASAECVFCL